MILTQNTVIDSEQCSNCMYSKPSCGLFVCQCPAVKQRNPEHHMRVMESNEHCEYWSKSSVSIDNENCWSCMHGVNSRSTVTCNLREKPKQKWPNETCEHWDTIDEGFDI